MSSVQNANPSRREVIKTTGQAVAGTALVGLAAPLVHAGENSVIQIALVGCGGRGTGAATNALSNKQGPTKLVAMADVFKDRLSSSHSTIEESHKNLMDVPTDRRFIGFDGYKKAMDCLKKGDVVILATPPAFRWVHFKYALEKGLHVFMEKPVAVDGPSARKLLDLAAKSVLANQKVAVGLMCRHCPARREMFEEVRAGKIGELNMLRAYRMAGPTASAFSLPKPAGISELMYQIQRFHSFLWASGGAYSDFLIHNIDEACWMKDAWPVRAQASGGRHYRGDFIDQNFDSYSVEYTYPDGAKLFLQGRTIPGCHNEFTTQIHGSKGSGIVSYSGHTPAKPRLFKGQDTTKQSDVIWKYRGDEGDPYQHEWEDLMTAIRADKPYNEAKRGAQASLVTAMGRMAAHTGQVITYDQMLKCEHEFAPEVDKLVIDGPAPVQAGANGKYPVPEPGIKTDREY
jgi:predicted dehydrogenase